MGFYEIQVDIQAIFLVFFLYSTRLKARKIPKITRISPVFFKNTWNKCIILQLFDFRSSYNACYRQLTGVKSNFSKCMYVLCSSSMMNANVNNTSERHNSERQQ